MEPGVGGVERGDHVEQRAGGDLDGRRPAGQRAQGGRDAHGHGHGRNPTGRQDQVSSDAARRYALTPRPMRRAWPRSTSSGARPRRPRRRAAVGHACWELGHDVDEVADVRRRRGPARRARRRQPRRRSSPGRSARPVEAAWRLDRRTAVIEMARASGLVLAGGADGNDPLGGDDRRHRRADRPGARRRAPAGSSSASAGRRRPTAGSAPSRRCAARPGCAPSSWRWPATCAPASSTRPPCSPRRRAPRPAQVGLLTARLEQLARRYRDEFGVDVTELDGAGAAGGLAGGLAALGGRLVGGFELVAEHVELDERRRRGRRRRHRRGLPRRAEPRRQGRRRRVRAGRARRAGRSS